MIEEERFKKNDFIEIAFTARTELGEVFDTNIQSEAEKINMNIKTRPLIICLGQAMILPAIDEFLIGKTPGNYTIELKPEKAFGNRNSGLIRTMPISVFKNQETIPQQGMMFQFDNMMGKISAVSGGRVRVDFNNPLAGKIVVYEINIKKKINNLDEKIKALINFFFRTQFDYEIKDKEIILKVQQGFEKFSDLFKDKFKEILDLDLVSKAEDKTTDKVTSEK